MARYVVIEFPDNEDAEEFIRRTNDLNEDARKEKLSFRRRIVGVFVKPGKTCECLDRNKANYGDKNWPHATIARGEKFGWWVCSRCNRPRAAGHQLVNQLLMSETYEGTVFNDFEFGVTSLDVSGIHTNNIKRSKKLRHKKKGK